MRARISEVIFFIVFVITLICELGISFGQNPPAMVAPSPPPNVVAPQPSPQPPIQAQDLGPGGLEAISPAQREAAETLIREKGGLTPEAMETLRHMPEFQGLSPSEIEAARQMFKTKTEGRPREEAGAKVIEEISGDPWAERDSQEEGVFSRFSKSLGKYAVDTRRLKRFGDDFFAQAQIKVIAQRKDIPVPEEYIIGPGDEVKVVMWGRVNAQYNLVVDRDGNIAIPQLGPMRVAGMTFKDMSAQVIEKTKQIVGANVDITMGGLKSIPVFVLGDVKMPGAYMVGPFATITDALLLARGPNQIGTMRNIQVRRNDKTIATYDLYDLFLKGDKSNDINLQAGDVVFVPVSGPMVAVAGNVRRPAVYELKESRTIKTILQLAGGLLPSADIQRVQVERIKFSEARIVLDIGENQLSKVENFLLEDGDLVKVFPIVDLDINAVYLYGNVKRPGKYQLKSGMRVSDLLSGVQDLRPETHYDYALIKRVKLPELTTELVPFDLGRVLLSRDSSQDILLKPMDEIYIFPKSFFKDLPSAVVEGEVRSPKKVQLSENSTVKDAILMAGGLSRDAYMEEAELYRTDLKTGEITLRRFNLGKALEGDPAHNLILQDQDRIVVHSRWEISPKRIVTVSGAVTNPGEYPYADNMTVKDLVFAAGNILESAYLDEAEIGRQEIREGKTATYIYKKINLKKALEGDPEHNVQISPFDILMVRAITDWNRVEYVTLTGEVNFPGRYLIKPGERLSSVLERAGGFTTNAHLRGAVFTRESTRKLQQASLDAMVDRLQRELIAASTSAISVAASAEEMQARKAEQEGVMRFIASLKELKATGRTTIHLAPLRLFKNSEFDIELQDGDTLHIPTKNEVINVVGAVMSQGSYVFRPNFDWKEYISMAGGYTTYADRSNIYIMKVDGSAYKVDSGSISWNPFSSRWEFTAFGEKLNKLEPGDTIVVPEKLTRIAWMREIKDLTQILMQMALTAGTVIKVF